jgi:ribosomal protein S18 acetylase RimI-like enzyme
MEGQPATQIRQLAAADVQAFSALRREVTADNPVPMGLTLEEELTRPLEGFREQLSFPEPNAAFGAFVGSELVGSAAVAWTSKFASSRHKVTLWGTFVSPRYRRRGIARALVEKAIAHAKANGVRRINLTVFVPNEPAVHLYRSLGFVVCGAEPEAVRIGEAFYDGQLMSLLLSAVKPVAPKAR